MGGMEFQGLFAFYVYKAEREFYNEAGWSEVPYIAGWGFEISLGAGS